MRICTFFATLALNFLAILTAAGQSASTSVVSANPLVIPVNGTTTITVQLRDASHANLTSGGATVSFVTPSAGSIGSVTDHGDGTYSAIYTAGGAAGSVTITPKLGSTNFSNTTTIVVSTLYTLDGTSGNNLVRHPFSTTGNLSLDQGLFIDYLLIGGGGGGGALTGGGGGAGGIQSGTSSLSASSFPVTIGSGGSGGAWPTIQGSDGGSSTAFGLTASGGLGAPSNRNGGQGGAPQSRSGGTGWTRTSGGDGASGGGGGGSSSAGVAGGTNSVGGAGGAGTVSMITGSSVTYAGGGGGGNEYTAGGAAAGAGGSGGGGTGGIGQNTSAKNGGTATNYGSGGGGGGAFSAVGGAGHAGVAILRYQGNTLGNIGGTVTSGTNSATGYTLHTFTSGGTFNLSALDLNSRLGSTLSGIISGSGNLTFNGPGTITLTGNNTYTGQTILTAGTTEVGNSGTSGTLGSGILELRSGTSLLFNRSNDQTIQNSIFLPGTGVRTLLNNGSGTLTLGSSGSITGVSASPATLRIGGSGSIILQQAIGTGEALNLLKTGTGNLTISSTTHNYTGTTSVDEGTLQVTGNTGTGAITVKNGAKLTGTGTIKGATTMESGATLQTGNGSVSSIIFDNDLTLSGGSHYNWKITNGTGSASTDWDHLQVNGALTITATSSTKININIWSILASGADGEISQFNPTESSYSWVILTATGGISGFVADRFNIVRSPSNGTGGLTSRLNVDGFSIVQDGNTLKLQYSPPATQDFDATDDLNSNSSSLNYTTNNLSGALTIGLGFYVDYLIIGGGGGGGSNSAGGGGAGGVRSGSTALSAASHSITVGVGGSGGTSGGNGTNGGSSSAFGVTVGGGSGASRTGGNSGSPQSNVGGSAWVNTSGDGAGGGGGAGAGGNGAGGGRNSVGGNGGSGISSSITGSAISYAGGGGGGNEYTAGASTAAGSGTNGGGNGGRGTSAAAKNAGSGSTYGSGGGGGGGFNGAGGAGAAGAVIVRYKGNSVGSVGGTVSAGSGTATGYTLHTFTGSGSLNLSGVNLNNRLRATHSGNFIGSGNLIYNGPGILTLTGTGHTYSGTTTISAGHLRVNSSITSSSSLSVASGATLSGTGTLPATTVSGTHAPGTSPGVQSISGDLTYNTGSTFQWELIANDATVADRGTDYDGVNVSGALTIQTGVTSSLVFNGAGSAVDWTDPFWSANHQWLVLSGASSTAITDGTVFGTVSVSADKNGVLLNSLVTRDYSTFSWLQTGNDIYLVYTAASSLPVTWKSFSGKEINKQVQLIWETASEQNTKDFVVEHAVDGLQWKAIGNVAAAGNSTTTRSYSFLHTHPAAVNHYRLLQRDLDGKQSYSSVINVKVMQSGLRILGNPVKSKQLVFRLDKTAQLVITNTVGERIYQRLMSAGTHRLSLEGKPAGVYLISAGAMPQRFVLE